VGKLHAIGGEGGDGLPPDTISLIMNYLVEFDGSEIMTREELLRRWGLAVLDEQIRSIKKENRVLLQKRRAEFLKDLKACRCYHLVNRLRMYDYVAEQAMIERTSHTVKIREVKDESGSVQEYKEVTKPDIQRALDAMKAAKADLQTRAELKIKRELARAESINIEELDGDDAGFETTA
jgi:hypothetical protein